MSELQNPILQDKLEEFEKRLGLKFSDKSLLLESLTHTSYAHEHPSLRVAHNERLEYLGDAVIELICSDYLFERHKTASEGELTAMRMQMVNKYTLAAIARHLHLADYVLLGKGIKRNSGRHMISILAGALEALIGAIYLEHGLEVAKSVFMGAFEAIAVPSVRNYKGELLELVQQQFGISPVYELVDSSGPEHNPEFIVAVYVENNKIAEGSGPSKREAEQNAAKAAIDYFSKKKLTDPEKAI